ncbi:MAG: LacI family DNA-binding transcriptional regulator [Spirochaetes bacterium]|nr:LacI family DNA-binding transcriptional regulator [Spirochaetota bacterium]
MNKPKKGRTKVHHRRLPDYLRDLIIQGELIRPGLSNGERLPGSRALAEKYSVSQITLMRVLKELVDEGILTGEERRRHTVRDIARCRNLTQHRGVVTVLVPELDYFRDFTRGLEEGLKQHAPERGLRLRVQSYQWDDASMLEQIGDFLESRRSVGMVLKLAEAPGYEKSLEGLLGSGVPVVLFDTAHPKCDSVVIDQTAGVHRALDYLAETGHETLCYLGRFTGRESIERGREAAFRSWFAARGREIPPECLIEFLGQASYDEWLPRLKRLLGASEKLGVFCYNDKDALWVYRALRIAGIPVPERLSLISYDDKYRITGYDPVPFDIGLSTVDARHLEGGKEAARLLVARMDHPRRKFEQVSLTPKLNLRQTSRPRN